MIEYARCIYRVSQKKDTILIVNNCFRFQDTNFYFKPFKKEVSHFLFDVWLGRFVKNIASEVAIKMLAYF